MNTAEEVPRTVNPEDQEFLEMILSQISFTDAGNYNIGIHLPFVGSDYLPGSPGSLFRPRHIGQLNSKIFEDGNLDAIAEGDNTRFADGFKWGWLDGWASELKRHPLVAGFVIGKNKGATAQYSGLELNFDYHGENAGEKLNRTLSHEDVSLSVTIGAILHNKTPGQLAKLNRNLRSMMVTSKPRSFQGELYRLFDESTKPHSGSVDVLEIQRRKEYFVEQVNEAIMGNGLNLMEHRYLR